MNSKQIDALIARRERITTRYSYRRAELSRIDAQLATVPPGQDNRIDRYLGRSCAVLPERADYGVQPAPQDYRIANRPDNPNWHGVKAWFDEAAGIAPAQLDSINFSESHEYMVCACGYKATGLIDGLAHHSECATAQLRPDTIAMIEMTRAIFEAQEPIEY